MKTVAAAICLFVAACGAPHTQTVPLEVHDARAAPTPGGVDVSAGYLTIANRADADDSLVAVTSPRASRVEIHEMTMDAGVMRMRQTPELIVPAHGEIELAPGGRHLMFYGVSQPFVAGETIPVRLTFESAGDVEVAMPVRRSAETHRH